MSPTNPRPLRRPASLLRKAGIAGAALTAIALAALPAAAVPFAGAFTQMRSPASGTPAFPEPFTIRQQATTDTVATAGADHAGDWGTASTSANADLVHGTLGARIAADAPDLAPGSAIITLASSSMVDGIATTGAGGTPYDWTSGHGQFSFSLDGTYTRDPGTDTSNVFATYVRLTLAQPGTMDPGLTVRSTTVLADYFWFVGDPNQSFTSCYTDGPCIRPVPLATFTEFPNDFAVDVNVGSDFDWGVSFLLARTAIGGSPKYDIDLGHTLTVSYQGPDGATSRSTSGLFGNILTPSTPVPASPTLGLLVGGLAIAALRRRRAVTAQACATGT